jgi:F-type H+-transporting ATPase subunit delta
VLLPARAGFGLLRALGFPCGFKEVTGAARPYARGAKDADMAERETHGGGVAERYATALFELASDERVVETVSSDFATLKSLLGESPELARLVKAPVFSAEQQKLGMDAVLGRMEASPLTVRFVLTLAKKRRLAALGRIIDAYEQRIAEQKGEVKADVTAARVLSEAETRDLKRVLKEKLGRDARLSTRVDPALLGGLVVKVGSRMIDSSLRTKLESLREAMRGH